jgi:hypothetical protein
MPPPELKRRMQRRVRSEKKTPPKSIARSREPPIHPCAQGSAAACFARDTDGDAGPRPGPSSDEAAAYRRFDRSFPHAVRGRQS